jgi:hypothetical protein
MDSPEDVIVKVIADFVEERQRPERPVEAITVQTDLSDPQELRGAVLLPVSLT